MRPFTSLALLPILLGACANPPTAPVADPTGRSIDLSTFKPGDRVTLDLADAGTRTYLYEGDDDHGRRLVSSNGAIWVDRFGNQPRSLRGGSVNTAHSWIRIGPGETDQHSYVADGVTRRVSCSASDVTGGTFAVTCRDKRADRSLAMIRTFVLDAETRMFHSREHRNEASGKTTTWRVTAYESAP